MQMKKRVEKGKDKSRKTPNSQETKEKALLIEKERKINKKLQSFLIKRKLQHKK